MKIIISFQDPINRVSAEIMKQLQRDFKDIFSGIGYLMECFHCRHNQTVNHTSYPQDM